MRRNIYKIYEQLVATGMPPVESGEAGKVFDQMKKIHFAEKMHKSHLGWFWYDPQTNSYSRIPKMQIAMLICINLLHWSGYSSTAEANGYDKVAQAHKTGNPIELVYALFDYVNEYTPQRIEEE